MIRRTTAVLAVMAMALFGSAVTLAAVFAATVLFGGSVALAEEPDRTYTVTPGSSTTFATPPLSYADRLDCAEEFATGGHYLQKPNSANTRCTYGATETNGQRNLQRTVCRGPFTYSLPVNYGKLDPDVPDSARNKIVRPNGARWTVSVPDDTRIGEVFTITIAIEGVHDIYFNNIHDGFQLSSRGAGCTLTKTVEVEVVEPRANHQDTTPLATARANRPVASSGDYVPPNTSRCTVVQFNRPSPRHQHDKTNSTSFMSWCGDLGEYAPNGAKMVDLCAAADVDCRRY